MTVPRLRQLVIAARHLETADQLGRLLGLGEPYIDPGVGEFGLANRVYAIGDQFLEVVVPQAADAPAQRFIDRGGEGGYMAIFQTDNLGELRARVDRLGIRRVWNIDLPDISASHLHPADIGGAIVSVDEARPSGSWRWGGPRWRDQSVPGRLTGAVMESPDPDRLAQRWALALGIRADERKLFLADAVIAFRKGPVERLVGFGIARDVDTAVRGREMGLAVQDGQVTVAGVTLTVTTD